jgi:DNA polymerase-1
MMGIQKDMVTADHRRVAKAINFGLVYGMSAFGLAEQLGIDDKTARGYIEKYFEQYPTVRSFIDRVVDEARSQGFVRTVLGRIRYIPELAAGEHGTRRLGERLAINTKIQGSAADIIKVAMINIDRIIKDSSFKMRMVLQIHDELVFEVPGNEQEQAKDLVIYQMENALKLKAPLEVNVGMGRNWAEAHN